MLSRLARAALGPIAFLAVALSSSVSHAETLTFYVRSEHPSVISMEFYSEEREHAWPGGNEVYVVDDAETHEYALSCRRGEKICLGAWVRGQSRQYWGVGKNRKSSCKSCCFICDGGQTRTQVLNR
ncbi:MAG: hypothetical protein ACR2PM_06805 [Hyphomicrobiales bacterium]